jgi:antitoxin VapB
MSLNLKDEETVALVSELAKRLGKTKTGAVREVVRDRLDELDRENQSEADARVAEFTSWLERDIWPHTRSQKALTKQEEEELLGYDEMLPL